MISGSLRSTENWWAPIVHRHVSPILTILHPLQPRTRTASHHENHPGISGNDLMSCFLLLSSVKRIHPVSNSRRLTLALGRTHVQQKHKHPNSAAEASSSSSAVAAAAAAGGAAESAAGDGAVAVARSHTPLLLRLGGTHAGLGCRALLTGCYQAEKYRSRGGSCYTDCGKYLIQCRSRLICHQCCRGRCSAKCSEAAARSTAGLQVHSEGGSRLWLVSGECEWIVRGREQLLGDLSRALRRLHKIGCGCWMLQTHSFRAHHLEVQQEFLAPRTSF